MASTKKKNKQKNAFISRGSVKGRKVKLKRIAFYNKTDRKREKAIKSED